uniref:Minimal SLOG domain-containing protein n=1 Tax=Candidatus Kentrum sp. MB TaxID=2138164 RepID=A0A451B7Q5_9GAMM|nr:MAG: protein of unknown function (DUF4326) [Candidatus Kentron sp. MB]VFK30312.1 MAG: protein of unknown function (DUF4326) [Candidatus Kentron sp. MB]VFK74277.1 MAG: protein of unknown function (DUF4326) [Candidatus Kentron sp. MB]
MNTQEISTILIAYPRDFACYGKFERKVSSILSNLASYHLAFLSDDNEFVLRYSSSDSRILDSLLQVDERQIEEGITHAIIFDDGNTYRNLIGDMKRRGIQSRIINTGLTKVVNRDRGEKYDIYIGRGSKWGNPYAIGFDGDRDEVIHKFKYDFERGFLKFSKEDALELKGRTLGCYCKPAACHGDVLAKYLNSLDDGA